MFPNRQEQPMSKAFLEQGIHAAMLDAAEKLTLDLSLQEIVIEVDTLSFKVSRTRPEIPMWSEEHKGEWFYLSPSVQNE